MPNLKKADIVRRLGFPLESLEFRGQCYDCGPGNFKVCALTQRPSRFCFTLRPIGSRGKVTISPSSFYLLKRHHPDLYIQLERGRLFLQLQAGMESRDLQQAKLQKRLGETQKKLGTLRAEARRRVYSYRAEHRRGAMPELLENLKLLLQRKEPEFTEQGSAMLFYEQAVVDLEKELLAPAAIQAPARTPAFKTPAATSIKERKFQPVPEIEF